MAEKKEKNKEKGKGKGLTIVIIILLVLILVGGGAFAGWMIFFNKKDTTTNTKTSTTAVNQAAVGSNVQGAGYEPSDGTFALDEFLVNLADDNAKRYLKVKISLGYTTKSTKKLTAELTEKTPEIRDAINSVLRAKKASDFTQKGVEDLKKEIINRVNIYLENGRFNNVYFNDILVQ